MPQFLKTLDDVWKSKQQMIAVCHQVDCRHSRVVDLQQVIFHVGAAHQIVPVKGKVHFSERMRCPQCGHLGMFIWVDVPKDPEPGFGKAGHAIKVLDWGNTPNGTLQRELAVCTNLDVARAGYEVACTIYPTHRITMQQGIFIMRDSRIKVIEGGKAGYEAGNATRAERSLWGLEAAEDPEDKAG